MLVCLFMIGDIAALCLPYNTYTKKKKLSHCHCSQLIYAFVYVVPKLHEEDHIVVVVSVSHTHTPCDSYFCDFTHIQNSNFIRHLSLHKVMLVQFTCSRWRHKCESMSIQLKLDHRKIYKFKSKIFILTYMDVCHMTYVH